MAAPVDVGVGVPGCALMLTNGGRLFSSSGRVGAGSVSNQVWVVGSGSIWSNTFTLTVGDPAGFNQVVISNGGRLFSTFVNSIGASSSASNSVTITGPGSSWRNGGSLTLGSSGSRNQFLISGGGQAFTADATTIGLGAAASNNLALVTGAGSSWSNNGTLGVGSSGSFNQLVVSNGGALFVASTTGIGSTASASNNVALVTGPGSLWNGLLINVGSSGSANRLVVSNSAVVSANGMTIGSAAASSNNLVVIHGGTLRVTNNIGTAVLDIRRGSNVFNGGLLEVDALRMTNIAGRFVFNSGICNVRAATVTNGLAFFVGNGVAAATLNLLGDGHHSFFNLTLRSNALLTGNGRISGVLATHPGAIVTPGTSIGRLILSNAPVLAGTLVMEISKAGGTLTNDQIHVNGLLTYGGRLIVTNLGPDALVAGDRFPIFTATGYGGSFTSIHLPPLSSGLTWKDNLLVDGSIEVAMVLEPRIVSTMVSGTNLVFAGTNGPANAAFLLLASTNIALPLAQWTPVLLDRFDTNRDFIITNAPRNDAPAEFYTLQVATPTIMFDNFDPGGGFDGQANYVAASAQRMSLLGSTQALRFAAQFIVTGGDFRLSSITLPISISKSDATDDVLRVRLTDGTTAPGDTLEVLSLNEDIWPPFENPFSKKTVLVSKLMPRLIQGSSYWIVTEPTAFPPTAPFADLDYRWWRNTSEAATVPIRQQQTNDGSLPADPWTGFVGVGPVAFSVSGVPVPP